MKTPFARRLRAAALVGATIAAVTVSSAFAQTPASGPPEERPHDFILRNITVTDKKADPKSFANGTAAQRDVKQSKQPPSYTKTFDLSGIPAYQPRYQLTGKVRVWGNNYMLSSGLAKAWGEAFKKRHPGVELEFVLPSVAIATPSLYFGVADVAMTHEPTFYDSLTHVRILGYEPIGFKALTGAYDSPGWMNTMAVVVHKDMPIDRINFDQLDGVYGGTRTGAWKGFTWHPELARGSEKNIRTWGQLGVKGALANKPITPYGYSVIYSTAVEFSRRVLQSSNRWNGDLHDYGNIVRPDGSTYLQYDQILDNLRKDPYGIAYVRYQPSLDKEFKVLKLAKTAAGPYVDFTLDNVQNRSYPLAGELSFFTSVKPGTKMNPAAYEWINFILSREAQDIIQTVDRKYLPLTPELVAEERKRLEQY